MSLTVKIKNQTATQPKLRTYGLIWFYYFIELINKQIKKPKKSYCKPECPSLHNCIYDRVIYKPLNTFIKLNVTQRMNQKEFWVKK